MRWLGRPEPQPPFENRSLTKYKLIIDDFGGWALFQALLQRAAPIADRHGTDIATVASRAMLDRPRSPPSSSARATAPISRPMSASADCRSDPSDDHAEIDAVLRAAPGSGGDTFELERDRTGRHGSIMKYNLNRQVA